jgi:hypothetical protein
VSGIAKRSRARARRTDTDERANPAICWSATRKRSHKTAASPAQAWRVLREEGEDVAPFQDHDAAVGRRPGIGCALLPVEERDLAANVSGPQYGEHDLPAVGRKHADPDAAIEHRQHAVTRGALQEDRVGGGIFLHACAGEQRVALGRAEQPKKTALSEQRSGAFKGVSIARNREHLHGSGMSQCDASHG